jgi:integration host factor subunit alpha
LSFAQVLSKTCAAKTSGKAMMASKTITRADLSEAIYRKVGLSRAESAKLVEQVLGEICDSLAAGEAVKLSGFGNFMVRSKGERVGRNPKTGVEVPIEKRRVMVFKPSDKLRAHMNGEAAEEED